MTAPDLELTRITNHFLIGLGGTGGRVLREFRRKLYEQFRGKHPQGLRIQYLYLDSSDKDLEMAGPEWRVTGARLSLEKNNVLAVNRGSDLGFVLENPSMFPHIASWIGTVEQCRDILGNIGGVNVFGGQRRRQGRLLFANAAGDFRTKLTTLLRSLEQDAQGVGVGGVQFHICCGLAGGTGSGSVVDTIAQIRDLFPDASTHPTAVYALLPEAGNAAHASQEGFYYENGYGALRELNALGIDGVWQPHNVASGSGGDRLDIRTAYRVAYLYTNTDEENANRPVEELPGLLAQFLYQKIVVMGNAARDPIRRRENLEDKGGIVTDDASKYNGDRRARRFASFGIKQLVYPEQEVREYLTASLTERAARALRYQHWTDGDGYQNLPRGDINWPSRVRDDQQLRTWGLSRPQAQLQLPILPTDRDCIPFASYWDPKGKEIDVEHQKALREAEAKRGEFSSSAYFNRAFLRAFRAEFREIGVEAYYQQRIAQVRDYAAAIVGNVDQFVRVSLESGTFGTGDLLSAVTELRNHVTETRTSVGNDRKRLLEIDDPKLRQEFDALLAEAAKLPRLRRDNRRESELLARFLANYAARFTLKTKLEALGFEDALYERFLAMSQDRLIEPLTALDTRLRAVADRAAAVVTNRPPQSDSGPAAMTKPLVRFVDEERVRAFRLEQTLQKELQVVRLQSSARAAAFASLAEPQAALADEAPHIVGNMEETLENVALDLTEKRQGELRDDERLLGVSILALLARRFRDDGEIASLARILMSHAGIFAKLSRTQIQLTGYGTGPSLTRFVVIPEDPHQQGFAERLVAALRAAGGLDDAVQHSMRDGDGKRVMNELSIVSTAHFMPLRYFEVTEWLRNRYEQRIAGKTDFVGQGDFVRYVVHSEGLGHHVIDPFPLREREVVEMVRAHLLVGEALGVVTRTRDVDGDGFELSFNDADGLLRTAALSGDLHTLQRVTEETGKPFLEETRRALSTAIAQEPAIRKKLRQTIVDQQRDLRTRAGKQFEPEIIPAIKAALALIDS